MMQGKGTLPLPLHPIPSNHRRRKCQGCARSKMSGMLPAVHASVAMLVWHSRPRLWSLGSKLFAPCLPLERRSAKFLAVFVGVVANLSKHLFIVTIAAQ